MLRIRLNAEKKITIVIKINKKHKYRWQNKCQTSIAKKKMKKYCMLKTADKQKA